MIIPRCKIFIFTYKRNNLLPRAIESLIAQTFKDWTCEVHNDCPGDIFPDTYLESLNDSRFIIKNHEINLGGTTSFNLAFSNCEEEYISILEDDNWWEPGFLKEMTAVMDRHPHINIAWSNMLVWREKANNEWENTNRTIWPENQSSSSFTWPDFKQAMGALHSNGAMIYRGKYAKNYQIPDNCDFSIIEGVRERTFEFPIYFNDNVLANFSLTMQSSRPNDLLSWSCSQIMLLGSYIQTTVDPKQTFKETLSFYRNQKPTPVANFFFVVIFILKDITLLTNFNLKDWYAVIKWTIKNWSTLWRIKQRLKRQQNVFNFLIEKTEALNKTINPPPSIGT
ncbi:glycosyltransferase family 2 protein [Mucilaginibacter sp.]